MPFLQGFLISAVLLSCLTIAVADSQPGTPAASTEPARLLTGRALRDALDERQSLTLRGISLRQAVQQIQHDTGVAIIIDRRVDPSHEVDTSTEYVTVGDNITAVAESVAAAASFGDGVVVIGPVPATSRLRTLTAVNRRALRDLRPALDAETYRSLTQPRDWSWPALAEPRQLLITAATGLGATVDNPEMIPHDLWAEATLPPLPFADFATLVLNQFDLNLEFTGRNTIHIVHGAESVVMEQSHRVPVRDKETVRQRWQKEFPRLTVIWKGSLAQVAATVETHERLRDLIRSDGTRQVAAAAVRDRLFTMQATAGTPIGQVIATLRKSGIRIGIEGRTDEELAPLLQQTVEFDLVKSPGSEFFPHIFRNWPVDVDVLTNGVVLKFPAP